MHIDVIKFGGSSLADNGKLKLAAKKTISFLEKAEDNKIVVIVSAQGKTTDHFIGEAKELSLCPNKRELDMLVSVGEQICAAKFTILLQEMGYKAISLTGWQAGIKTNSEYTEAKITGVYPSRILDELENNQIVVITGFQGIDEQKNITTLGRDGSDTTAVAVAAALQVKECYIFTDIDGIYTEDPNKNLNVQKLEHISYDKMIEMTEKGAKVLHTRCVYIAKKYHVKIIVKSTFEEGRGSIIN